MREMTIEQVAHDVEQLEERVEQGSILLTRNGRPFAVVLGLEHYDAEDIGYMASADFWKMIRERRKEPTTPWEIAKKEILADDDQ